MADQLNYLNNLNKPNLVDLSLLQKINDGYQYSPPKISYLYSMVQTAGNATCSLAKDNLFIFVVIMCLVLFLIWCYVEKQRQNAIYEKYLQKKLAKSLLNDELNLFTETPDPINVEKLFVDINESMVETINPEPEPEEKMQVNYVSKNTNNNVHMTKREQNLQIYDSNQRVPEHMKNSTTSNQSIPLAGNDASSRYMDINNFNGSYMLM
jgi:hypothetical protein